MLNTINTIAKEMDEKMNKCNHIWLCVVYSKRVLLFSSILTKNTTKFNLKREKKIVFFSLSITFECLWANFCIWTCLRFKCFLNLNSDLLWHFQIGITNCLYQTDVQINQKLHSLEKKKHDQIQASYRNIFLFFSFHF